jgi:hypothetical protein
MKANTNESSGDDGTKITAVTNELGIASFKDLKVAPGKKYIVKMDVPTIGGSSTPQFTLDADALECLYDDAKGFTCSNNH